MKTRKFWLLYGSLSLILALLLACAPRITPVQPSPTVKATPTEVPVSFAGKTITIIVPFAPGGANDILARLFSRYLPKYLPGNPTMMVRNMPGANSTIGANYVYLTKPDGLTLLIPGSDATLSQLLGLKAARYDLRQMPTFIGIAIGAVIWMKTGIVSKPEEVFNDEVLAFGSTAGGTAMLFISAKELLDIPTRKVILAYSGSGETTRAVFAGEINASALTTVSYSSSILPFVEKGEAMALFQSGLFDEKGNLVKDPGLAPDILTLLELYEKVRGKPPAGAAWDSFKAVVAATLNHGKGLFLPPGTAESISRGYWDAAERMVKDPEFRRAVDPLVGPNAPWAAGEAIDKRFKQDFQLKPEVAEWFRSTVPKYGVVIE